MEPIINQQNEAEKCVDESTSSSKEASKVPTQPQSIVTTPVSFMATSKRASDEGNDDTQNNDHLKRSRVEKNEDNENKSSASSPTPQEEILDLARSMELNAGDRLEVQWEVDINDDQDQDKVDEDDVRPTSDEGTTTMEPHVHWWGATLLEHDGRTDDQVAIRTLLYDPYPEGGFPEASREDVIFMGPNVLLSYPSQDELNYRILTADGSEVSYIISNDQDIEELVDTILSNALQNTSSTFQLLERSQQIKVAEKIATKKEKLIELIKEHMMNGQESLLQSNRTVTAQDALLLLARAMQSE